MYCTDPGFTVGRRSAVTVVSLLAIGVLSVALTACGDEDGERPNVPPPDAGASFDIPVPITDTGMGGDGMGDGTISDATDSGSEVDAGPVEGGLLWPCTFDDQCDSQFCIPTDVAGNKSVCTVTCSENCPEGWGCKSASVGADIIKICAPPLDSLCAPCSNDSDCVGPLDKCLALEGGHCGRACSADEPCPEHFSCVAIGGDDAITQCVPNNQSCNCAPDVEFETDNTNCGECGKECSYDNAVAICKGGNCEMGPCIDEWSNLNKSDEDGCEYQCTATLEPDPEAPDAPLIDWPDAAGLDEDCDGIDGTAAYAVFVAPDGVDQGNTAGTRDLPFKTIKKAMEHCASDDEKVMVLVSKGTYITQLVVIEGVSVFGGYDRGDDWSRDLLVNETIVRWEAVSQGVIRALVAADIEAPTTIDGLTIQSASNPAPGGSAIAVHVTGGSAGLVLSNNRIVAGNGGPGIDGDNGDPGQLGNDGAPGTEGVDDSCKPEKILTGGPGGTNLCPDGEAHGGAGGDAGWGGSSKCKWYETIGCLGECKGRVDAKNGGNGFGTGGIGGEAQGVEKVGLPGHPGDPGDPGADGAAGSRDGIIGMDDIWRPAPAEPGTVGLKGSGGGGGGGGGGSDNGAVGDASSHGGSGGGGGAGGCGGTPGEPASGGGGSIAILIVASSPTLANNFVVYRNGGNGGIGGVGGTGGPGGLGKDGGGGWDDSKGGGKGGDGGQGGRGGHGGGGGGGPSVGVFLAGPSDPVCEGNIYSQEGTPGLGGIGGDGGSDVSNGDAGLSAPVVNQTTFCTPE